VLNTLRLQNYRCFDDHTVAFHAGTVVVGRNNAGKSTIVEALQLIAAVVNRKATTFSRPPADSSLGPFQSCIIPKIAHLGIDLRTAFHRYGDPPAVLTATFTGGGTVTVYVRKEGVHATIMGPQGWITSTAAFKALRIPHINILPQVAPLQAEETNLRDKYISENYYSRRSSRHFRNEILQSPDHFEQFKSLAEQTWHGLRIEKVSNIGNTLSMLVTDGDFAAEVAWMGHGLQMWLQTIRFVAKTPTDATAVLDGHQDRSLGPGGANKTARILLDQRWQHDKLHIVSGKAILSRLSAWTQEHWGATLGPMAIAKAFNRSEIPEEMQSILTSIEEGTALASEPPGK